MLLSPLDMCSFFKSKLFSTMFLDLLAPGVH